MYRYTDNSDFAAALCFEKACDLIAETVQHMFDIFEISFSYVGFI